jgi:hypothetical protein
MSLYPLDRSAEPTPLQKRQDMLLIDQTPAPVASAQPQFVLRSRAVRQSATIRRNLEPACLDASRATALDPS